MVVFSYLLLVVPILTYAIYFYFSRHFNYWKMKGIVGPEPVPFFGNLKESVLRRKNIGVVFRDIYENFPKEKVVGVYRMTTPSLLIRDLDIIKNVLIKDFDVFVDRGVEFSKKGLGANLFHSDGETWRVLRNRFTPVFTSSKLKNMFYLIAERGDSFIEYISKLSEQQPEQEVHSLFKKYTISTISACAFGLDIDTINNKLDVLEKLDKIFLVTPYTLELDMMYPGILKKMNIDLFPAFIKTFFFGVVKQIIAERNGQPSNRKDFMDLILEMRQKGVVYSTKKDDEPQLSLDLTDEIISAQAFVFYVGGYESSATTMSFLFYELAKNPDVQERLHTEVVEVLKRYDGKVSYEALHKMAYLNNVFDETLRLYPIVEPLQRNTMMDYKVPGTDLVIEKGTTVLISPYGIHHDAKYYPDPEKFDPDRFTAENSKDRHQCAYLPFGNGPRNCIGEFKITFSIS